MIRWLWCIPLAPLAGFVILALAGIRSRPLVASIAAGLAGLSLAAAAAAGIVFVWQPPPDHACDQMLGLWLGVGGLEIPFGLQLDALSLIFTLTVAGVGFAIVLYATCFMAASEGYSRFFAYMSLFLASMQILVLADNLLLLYLGWEGVGLCSYLLIGFWYRDPANGRAAQKAFLMTRIGDVALLVGVLLLFAQLGTLGIQPLQARAHEIWPAGSILPTVTGFLLLAGAVGKSAQLPLQTWLPDAMAGPTPVSALIHAATMVTAGVYLIARMNILFTLAPAAMNTVAWLGTATLLLASLAALAQRDLKRILAYSTMGQVGYMFLALGTGAWTAGIYHFLTHALFKGALFLGAGIIIMALHEEHDIFKMGGLRTRLPGVYRAMLLAALTLASLPPFTLTFNSKDLILRDVWLSGRGGPLLWALGTVGAFLTALYAFRLIFVVFFGQARTEPAGKPSRFMTIPLAVLAWGGALAGVAELLSMLDGCEGFYRFLERSLPPVLPVRSAGGTLLLQAVSVLVSLAGVGMAYASTKHTATAVEADRPPVWLRIARDGFGFDAAYHMLFVRPFGWVARANARDVLDWCLERPAAAAQAGNRFLVRTQSGKLRWYAMGVAAGTIILIVLTVWL